MHIQEWLRSLRSGGSQQLEVEDLRSLLPSLPSLSSLSLSSLSSLVGLGALASLTAYWLVTRPRAIRPPCDLQAQSIAVQGDHSCRRSALLPDDNLLDFYFEDTKTAYDMFQRGLRISGEGPCLGYRKPGQPYEWISYTEVAERAQVLGSGLLAKGCKPNPNQFVGIFAQNRPEWVIAELACYTYSMAVVPLYDTLGVEAMVHILDLAEISLVLCDKEEKAMALLANKEKGLTLTLSCLVLFNPFSETLVERAQRCGVEVLRLDQLMDLGRQNLQAPLPPQPQDLAVVCFTSGTTGKPKGAMITHGNIASNTSSVIKILEGYFVIRQEDVSISYLPLAHMFERMIQVSMFCHGARVGFYQGDISLLMDDIKTLRPTFFPVVPRLLNRIYDKIMGSVTSPFKRAILQYAVRRKQAELSSGVVRNNSLWDRLVFSKIQVSHTHSPNTTRLIFSKIQVTRSRSVSHTHSPNTTRLVFSKIQVSHTHSPNTTRLVFSKIQVSHTHSPNTTRLVFSKIQVSHTHSPNITRLVFSKIQVSRSHSPNTTHLVFSKIQVSHTHSPNTTRLVFSKIQVSQSHSPNTTRLVFSKIQVSRSKDPGQTVTFTKHHPPRLQQDPGQSVKRSRSDSHIHQTPPASSSARSRSVGQKIQVRQSHSPNTTRLVFSKIQVSRSHSPNTTRLVFSKIQVSHTHSPNTTRLVFSKIQVSHTHSPNTTRLVFSKIQVSHTHSPNTTRLVFSKIQVSRSKDPGQTVTFTKHHPPRLQQDPGQSVKRSRSDSHIHQTPPASSSARSRSVGQKIQVRQSHSPNTTRLVFSEIQVSRSKDPGQTVTFTKHHPPRLQRDPGQSVKRSRSDSHIHQTPPASSSARSRSVGQKIQVRQSHSPNTTRLVFSKIQVSHTHSPNTTRLVFSKIQVSRSKDPGQTVTFTKHHPPRLQQDPGQSHSLTKHHPPRLQQDPGQSVTFTKHHPPRLQQDPGQSHSLTQHHSPLWDSKVQAGLGGNLRFILTASAPISPAVLSFLRAALGCLIFEGYGQTECTAGCTFSMPGDWSAGHVGAPLPCAMVKLTDIPEMNYYAQNGEGEICIRGPSVFRGYLKDEERTAEALDSDGWLHSGDVGQWLANGTLRIIDRKKHIFKLSQGEYIAPEKIENIYTRCGPVLQVFVHGDSLESHLVGIVVPDPEVFTDWAKERGIMGSYEELCQNPDVKKAVLEDMTAVGKEAGLKSFEQVKDLYLHPEQFSISNGLLTPTLKSRRMDLRKAFEEQIRLMYGKTAA
ncbi:hypothetical protein ACEWY4_011717 [Coilia grayii]|uniref:long-chain-fatty-acid--CoA ligase n=1 Tax=Coilia grayii TaxID=363190 RepID=A0ABD1JYI5_9TELE